MSGLFLGCFCVGLSYSVDYWSEITIVGLISLFKVHFYHSNTYNSSHALIHYYSNWSTYPWAPIFGITKGLFTVVEFHYFASWKFKNWLAWVWFTMRDASFCILRHDSQILLTAKVRSNSKVRPASDSPSVCFSLQIFYHSFAFACCSTDNLSSSGWVNGINLILTIVFPFQGLGWNWTCWWVSLGILKGWASVRSWNWIVGVYGSFRLNEIYRLSW